MSVFVIAALTGEPGTAGDLVDAAAASGANAVVIGHGAGLEPELFELKAHTESRGLEFIAAPHDVESLWFLVRKVKVRHLKIASGDTGNVPLLTAAIESGLPLIVSAGSTSAEDIHASLRALTDYAGRADVTFLHSPETPEQTNLGTIYKLTEQGYRAGYASHTDGIDDVLAAVAIGAQMVEKGLTLAPSAKAAVGPTQFRQMWDRIQNICDALGNDSKAIMPGEERRGLPGVFR